MRTLAVILALACVVLVAALGSVSQADKSITADSDVIVTGADAIYASDAAPNAELSTAFGQVMPRVVTQYPNATLWEALVAAPSALPGQLANVIPRAIASYADAMMSIVMGAPPGALSTSLAGVAPHVRVQYADRGYLLPLQYPAAFFDDGTPPVISNVVGTLRPTGNAAITWTTDEPASSEAACGLVSGHYTITASTTLLVTAHQIGLPGLDPEASYYCVVRSADGSGNLATSPEFQLELVTQWQQFLPAVLR
jgi:hypothetical protein